MSVYSASYFEPQNHCGSLLSISRSVPKAFRIDGKLSFFMPSQGLLQDWKQQLISETEYTKRFRDEINVNWPDVLIWLNKLEASSDLTLLCWERAGKFCHRNLVMRLLEKHRPDCFGGCDLSGSMRNLTCPSCQSLMIPGLDRSYCKTCREWKSSR